MTELKPCPFCGGGATIVYNSHPRLTKPSRNGVCHVVCFNCDTEMGYDEDYGGQIKTRKEAITAWNRREGDEE